jgi:hypothetical protein
VAGRLDPRMYETPETPGNESPLPAGVGRPTVANAGPIKFDWEGLVPRLVHPAKVVIVEALLWIGTPLSATDLSKMCSGRMSVGMFAHHIRALAKVGLVRKVGERSIRGSTEKFYFFPDQRWEFGLQSRDR